MTIADRTVGITLTARVTQYTAGIRSAAAETLKLLSSAKLTGAELGKQNTALKGTGFRGYAEMVRTAEVANRKAAAAAKIATVETAKFGEVSKVAALENKQAAATAQLAAQALEEQHRKFTAIGTGMVAVGGAAALGIAAVLKVSTEFGSKMAQLQSLSHATSSEMKNLSDAAMTTGQAYGFTASQVADAEIELQKAGVGVKEQLGGALKGALTLAAAGQLDVAQATEISTVAMTQFGLSAKQVPHLADMLSAGADKALGSVGDLGEALKNGGLQAHNMGLTIEDTVGLLSGFANAGILGAEAGTQMRSMFIQLQKPTKQARDVLDQYGITLNDQHGKFVGITSLAGQLQDKLGKVSQAQRNAALATIFGSHAIVGATALYNLGAKGVDGWIHKVDESGFASAQAAGKMNSLQGDVQKLSAAFQTDLIKAGTSADGAFRPVVQSITNVVKVFGEIPGPLLGVGVSLTAIVAGVGLLGGAFLIAVPKIVAFRAAMSTLREEGSRIPGVMGKITGALAIAGAAAAGFASAGNRALAGAEDMGRASDTISGHFKNLDSQFKSDNPFARITSAKDALDSSFGNNGWNNSGVANWIKSATGGLLDFTAGWQHSEATFNAFGQQLAALTQNGKYAQATQGFNDLLKSMGGGADTLHELQSATKDYRESIINLLHENHIQVTEQNILNAEQGKGAAGLKIQAAAQAEAAAAAKRQAAALAGLRGEATNSTKALDQLEQAIEGFGSAQLDARSASRKLEGAFDDAMSTIKKNGRTLSDFTKKGRENGDALDGIATSALNAAAKYLHLNHDAAGAAKVLAHGRSEFIKAAEAAGLSGKAAGTLADKLGLIPKNISTAVKVTGATGVGGKIAALSKAAKGYAKTYEAELRANGVPAAKAHKAAQDAARRWDKTHATATLDGNNKKALAAAKQANAQATAYAQKQYLATLLANGVPADKAIKMARNAAKAFDSLNPRPTLSANPGPAIAAADRAIAALNAIHDKNVYINVRQRGTITGVGRMAAGGQVDGPGPKGVDSVPALLAPGEHVLTTKDVDRLGGQGGVYRFRAALETGQVGRFATGGAALRTANERVADARKAVRAAKTAAARRSANTRLAAALRHLKDVEHDIAVAKAKAAAKLTADQRKAAAEKRESLRQAREDFVSEERRDPTRRTTSPLSYVDELRQMSRNTDLYSTRQRKTFDRAANKYETALVKLTAASEKATQKLDDLKNASSQMRDSIKQSIAGGFTLNGAGASTTRDVKSGWINRDGIRFQTYSTVTQGPTAKSIAAYYKAGAGSAKQFAAVLKQLASKGLNPNLLAELANMGTEQGLPIAQALASATGSQLKAINANYTAIGKFADAAGKTVADDNYAKQIAAADRNADKITAQLTKDGEALRKLIAKAFGLKGYAVGTTNATPGLHWVGERGPELLQFAGGERVTPIPAGHGPAGRGCGTQRIEVRMPEQLRLVDVDGTFRGMVRVEAQGVARRVMHEDDASRAVLMVGGAAL